MKPDFSFIWNLLKGGVGGVGGGALGAIMAWVIRVWNGGDSTLDTSEAAAFGAVLGWILLQGKNLIKQSNLGLAKYIPVFVCAVALQGCVGLGLPNTLSKPVEHETKLNITQPPTMNPDGTLVQGETTEYYKKWRGGAGVESTKSDNLRMGIDKDGNWYVEQGEASQLSTQGQVQGIVEGMQLNLQAIMAGYALGSQGINVAAPLIGQKMQFDATQRATDSQNDALFKSKIVEALTDPEVLKAWQKLTQPPKVTKPADSPLGDVKLPEVGTNP